MSNSLGFQNHNLRHTIPCKIVPVKDYSSVTHSNINIQYDVTVPLEKKHDSVDATILIWKDYLWRYSSFTVFVLLTLFFLVYSLSMYEAKKSYILPSLIGVTLSTGCITWFRHLLSMNLFHKEERNLTRTCALLLYLLASACFFASSIAVMQKNFVIQFLSSLVGSIIGWKGFVVIFEGVYKFPTKQQLAALFQILVLSGLWELRTFLVNMHFVWNQFLKLGMEIVLCCHFTTSKMLYLI